MNGTIQSCICIYLFFLIFLYKKISDNSILLTQKESCPKKHSKISLFFRGNFPGLSHTYHKVTSISSWHQHMHHILMASTKHIYHVNHQTQIHHVNHQTNVHVHVYSPSLTSLHNSITIPMHPIHVQNKLR